MSSRTRRSQRICLASKRTPEVVATPRGPEPTPCRGGVSINDSTPAPKLWECGCGEPAPISTRTTKRRGWVKGEPKRFIPGHVRPIPVGNRTCAKGHEYVVKRWANGRTTNCPTCQSEYRVRWHRERRNRLRREAVAALGGVCVRCGITNPVELDHVNDDGYLLSRTTN